MDFLDEYESWSLLCQTVFGDQESYPVEFEEIGQQIARKCEGLPLAIVVMGGLLSKSDMSTREYWEYVAQNLSSVVNSEHDEHCLNVLSLSYKQLPVHLKPCFLYMGIFPGDGEIHVSKLIRLWVAEGFLKPIVGKSLEEVAEEYLKDLVDRNLILVETRKSNGKMKSCGIHDLLRDLCIKEAHKENFFRLMPPPYIRRSNSFQKFSSRISNFFGLKGGDRHPSPPDHLVYSSSCIKDARRLVIPELKWCQIYKKAKSASLTRSLFSESTKDLIICFRLLRIVDHLNDYSHETIMEVVNSRYLAFRIQPSVFDPNIHVLFSMYRLRNLQTLLVSSSYKRPISLPSSSSKIAQPISLPSQIWEMPHLRHIEIKQGACFPLHPPTWSNDLPNLQTLSTITNFSCDYENFLKRIPNLKKLKISVPRHNDYKLNNLVHLQKLESLNCRGFGKILLGDQAFPDSIKKLTLNWLKLPWEEMNIIGSLPNLEVLKLRGAAYGEEWNTAEGGFLKLKYLLLESVDVWHWETESSHFPRLESLIIRYCEELEEIPYGIGEIPTLKLIELYDCGEEANSSAQQIQEEQRKLGNEDLQVRVKLSSTFIYR